VNRNNQNFQRKKKSLRFAGIAVIMQLTEKRTIEYHEKLLFITFFQQINAHTRKKIVVLNPGIKLLFA